MELTTFPHDLVKGLNFLVIVPETTADDSDAFKLSKPDVLTGTLHIKGSDLWPTFPESDADEPGTVQIVNETSEHIDVGMETRTISLTTSDVGPLRVMYDEMGIHKKYTTPDGKLYHIIHVSNILALVKE
jgi:hypothetical protein